MNKKEIICFLLVALFLAAAISPFASRWPDGLEKVAEDKKFSEKSAISSPLPDYRWPGLKNAHLAIAFSGITGTLIVFILGWGVARLVKRKS